MRRSMGGPRGRGMMGPMMDPRSKFFMALASDQRLKILELLKEGEKNSADIISELGLDPSVVSRHLMMLRNVGLVSGRKEGGVLFFSIADERIREIINLATQMIKDWFDQHMKFF